MIYEDLNRLTDLYFQKIEMKEISFFLKKKIFDNLKIMTKKGIPLSIIESSILQNAIEFEQIIQRLIQKDNLIKDGQFYFHPALQIAPPAPVIIAHEDGTFSDNCGEFYLEMKTYFTPKDLFEYFCSKFDNHLKNENRDIGGIKHLLNNAISPVIRACKKELPDLNELDLFLFTVDAARAVSHDTDKQVRGILGLDEFVEDGLYLYKERVNYCRLNDLTHVH